MSRLELSKWKGFIMIEIGIDAFFVRHIDDIKWDFDQALKIAASTKSD